jgi:hypothetical protein
MTLCIAIAKIGLNTENYKIIYSKHNQTLNGWTCIRAKLTKEAVLYVGAPVTGLLVH